MSGPADCFPPMPCDRVLSISDRPTVAELTDLLRHVGPDTVVWVAHGSAGVRELAYGSIPTDMSPRRAGALIIRLPGVPTPAAAGGWVAPPNRQLPALTADPASSAPSFLVRIWRRMTT